MCRVLSAKDRGVLGHIRLDERMPHPSFDRLTTCSLNCFGHDSGGDEIINNHRGGLACILGSGNLSDRDHGGNGRGRDKFAAVIDYKAPDGIDIKRQADIRHVETYGGLKIDQACRLNRIRTAVEERTVNLKITKE